mgnify:CR=1 FL=1
MIEYDTAKIPNHWTIIKDPMNRDTNEIQLKYEEDGELKSLITVEQAPNKDSNYYLEVQDREGSDTSMGSRLPVESTEKFSSLQELKFRVYELSKEYPLSN